MAKQQYEYQDCIVIIPEYAHGVVDYTASFTIHRDDIIKVKYIEGYSNVEITGRFDSWSDDHYSINVDMSDKYKNNLKSISISTVMHITKVEE